MKKFERTIEYLEYRIRTVTRAIKITQESQLRLTDNRAVEAHAWQIYSHEKELAKLIAELEAKKATK